MFAKCLVAFLAVAAEISAYKYNQESVSYEKPEHSTSNNYKYCYQPAQISDKIERIVTSSVKSSSNNQNIGYTRPEINTSPITRNLVARGKYPVTLQSCGPTPDKKIPVLTSHLRAPVQEKPTVRLQAKIPAPKTIAHTCTCYKTILKPRVQQHLISVPSIQRYIETFHRPVVENIHYEAYPIRCSESTQGEEKEKTQTFQVQPVEISSNSGMQNDKNSEIQTLEIPRCFEIPKEQSEKSQVIEIPRIQFSEEQKPQTIEIPRIRFAEEQKPQTIEIPRIRFAEEQKPQTIEIPRIRFAEEQKPQTIEIPRVQFIQAKKPQTVQIELPRVQYVEQPQKSEGFDIPHSQFFDNKKPQFVEILNAQFVENSGSGSSNNNNNNHDNNQNNNNNSNNKAENVQLPRVEYLQTQKLQTVEIPRIQIEESPKCQTVEIPLGGTQFMYQFKQ